MNHIKTGIGPVGLGPSPQDPLYGLLDLDDNFFYCVDHRKHIIDELAGLFDGSKNIFVASVHECENWSYNMIDNDVCYNWGINIFDPDLKLQALKTNLLSLSRNNKQLDADAKTTAENIQCIARYLTDMDHQIKRIPVVQQKPIELFPFDNLIKNFYEIEQQIFNTRKQNILNAKQDLYKILQLDTIASLDYQRNLDLRAQAIYQTIQRKVDDVFNSGS